MKLKGAIAQTTTDLPKIRVTSTGAEVTLELAEVSIDEIRQLVGKELEIELKAV